MTATAAEEVAGLDNVLTRLALTEDQGLEKVLARLIPAVIGTLKSPHDATRKKVMEILSHVNKRVKGQTSIKLPLAELLKLATDSASAPMVRSFALVYTEMSFDRAAVADRLAAIPTLLEGVSTRPSQHAAICTRLAVSALAGLTAPVVVNTTTATEEALAKYPFLASEGDRNVLLAACMRWLLYQPRSTVKINTPLQAAMQGLGAATADAAAAAAAPIPGLSTADNNTIEEKGIPLKEKIAPQKVGILNFLATCSLNPKETVAHYLAASVDPNDNVCRRGEELLKKTCGLDSVKPSVDVEDPALIARLMLLYHGNAVGSVLAEAVPEDKRVQAAGIALRSRLMSVFCKSITAANVFPQTLQTIHECVYSEGSSLRLKQQGMEFTVWVFRHAAVHQLKAMGPAVLKGLLSTLEDSGPTLDSSSMMMRGFAYQAIGSLAQRLPELFSDRADIAHMFFTALSVEPAGLRATVAESAASLSSAYKNLPPAQQSELDKLLLDSMSSTKDVVRLSAVQWGNKLSPYTHVQARYLCVLAAGDAKLEVREEGLKGLRLSAAQLQAQKKAGTPEVTTADAADGKAKPDSQLPSLRALLRYLKSKQPRLFLAADGMSTRSLVLPPRSMLALVQFASTCHKDGIAAKPAGADTSAAAEVDPEELPDASDEDLEGRVPHAYLSLLEAALARDSTSELVVEALQSLLSTVALQPEGFESRYHARTAWLRSYLAHIDAGARLAAARLLGAAVGGMPAAELEELLPSITAAFTLAPKPAKDADPGASPAKGGAGLGASGTPSKWEEQEGSLLATGYIIAQVSTGRPSLLTTTTDSALLALKAALNLPDSQLAATAAMAISMALFRGLQQLPDSPPETVVSVDQEPAAGDTAAPMAVDEEKSVEKSVGKEAEKTKEGQEKKKEEVVKPISEVVGGPMGAVVEKVVALTTDKDVKAQVRAVVAAGLLASSCVTSCPAAIPPLLEAVFKLSSSKSEDVHFAVGEMLSHTFGGVPISADRLLRSNFASLADEFSIYAPTASSPAAVAAQLEATSKTASMAVDGDCEARTSAQDVILSKLLKELIHHSRTEVRCAASVWMVSLLTYCGGRHPRLLSILGEIQDSLSHLLGDANELTQEMASRGVSIVYSLGDEETQKRLVEALVGVLQGGVKAKQAVKLSGETQVFGDDSAMRSQGEGLSTYKELCSLATDLGQPDLIYKFMDLAHHQQAMNTRRGAAFGFAGIAKLAGEQLTSHVATLVPKLYRYQYDPNQRVQDAMGHIWRSLVDDPKKTVDEHFTPIMKELLREMGGRLWRNRQAACSALGDLLQGRRWVEVKEHLGPVWSMMLRCLDDIKETVRSQAETLARVVRGLSLRLVDPAHVTASDCTEAVAMLLPLLLEEGLGSSVKEVRLLALDTLSKLSKAAGAEHLRPHLAPLVQAMLEALSNLEDARLNYIEQHAERMGMDSDKLDNARVNASRSSPMGDTLDLCARFADPGSLTQLVPVLTGLVKGGVGLNTKVGTARFIRNLVARATDDIKPHTPALVKALTSGCRSERSGAVRKAYAGASAQLLKYAGPKRVEKTVTEAVEMYSQPSADSDSRYVGGLILRELLRAAPELFQEYAAQVLPLAFGAKMDDDSSAAAIWKEVWEEGVSSEAGAVRLYGSEIVGVLTEGLASSQWGRKKACAEAIVQMTQLGSDVLVGPNAVRLTDSLLMELGGRLWDGKEKLLDALGALAPSAQASLEPTPGHLKILEVMLTAASRKKVVYRTAALKSLESCLKAFPSDYFDKVSPPLLEAIQKNCAPPEAKVAKPVTSAEGEEDEVQDKPWPLVECILCLSAAFSHVGKEVVGDAPVDVSALAVAEAQGCQLAEALEVVLKAQMPWQQRLAAIQAMQALVKRSLLIKLPLTTMAGWCNKVVPDIATIATDIKIQTVRSVSLACLEVLASAAGAKENPAGEGMLLEAQAVDCAIAAADAVMESDKNAAVVAAASKVKELLVPHALGPTTMDT